MSFVFDLKKRNVRKISHLLRLHILMQLGCQTALAQSHLNQVLRYAHLSG